MITTIIPTFRRPQLLARAIQSALDQTVQDIRVMVFDNCSGDETEEVVTLFSRQDSRIVYYRHAQCIRAVENFQYGFSQVETPFFSVLSDDDYLDSRFYEKALEGLTKYPTAYFFLGSTIDVNKNGKILRNSSLAWPDKEYYEKGEGAVSVISKYINWTGSLFRKEVLNFNSLDSDVKAIDFDFMVRLSIQYPFVFSKNICAYFVQHENGYSSFAGLTLFWPGFLKIVNNANILVSPNDKGVVENSLHNFFQKSLFSLACRAWKDGCYDELAKIVCIACSQPGDHTKICRLQKYALLSKKIPLLRWLYIILYSAYQSIKRRSAERLSMV